MLSTFNVGVKPYGSTCIGTDIWIANDGGNSVTELRSSNGSVIRTFAVGFSPESFAFDGSSVWVSNNRSKSITKMPAS
jgi:hypothetical protein